MTEADKNGFLRHIKACNNASLPGRRIPFYIAGQLAGFADPKIVPALDAMGLRKGDVFDLPNPSVLESLGEILASQGLYRPHDELFDVWGPQDGQPPLGVIDRGALPLLGFVGVGVHLNGLVRKEDGLHLWVGRRARDKRLDPGKLDHLVAGGVPAGLTPAVAIEKEAAEEASLPADMVRENAREVALIRYSMERPEGLRRDKLICYDLVLPDSFQPVPADGEVEEFLLLPIREVVRLVRDTDEFKFNVNLVLIDLFLREGLINATSSEGRALRRGLSGDA